MNPDILLADEVLAVGDLDFQERCLDRVQAAGKAGMSVLFVSHDMEAITRLCTRVLWLNAGEIVKVGDPEEVVAEYQNASWSMTGRRIKDTRSGSHKGPAGEVLFVMLTGADDREVGAVRAADDVLVKVGVRLDLAPVSASFVLHVSAHGTTVFRSRSEFFPADDSGTHVSTVRIPGGLLAETIYSVSVDVIIVHNGTDKHALSAYNAVSFQVFDPASGRRDKTGGLVAHKLKWTFTAQGRATPSS
jgi:lipopolysaccharide transport system ATP-binding protein